MSVEEMEGQQPSSPEEKKVNGQNSNHPSDPNEVIHSKCGFINTNRINDEEQTGVVVTAACPVGGSRVEAVSVSGHKTLFSFLTTKT